MQTVQDELERIKALLLREQQLREEEQRARQGAERRYEEEQRLRGEEQRLREEEQRLREEEQRLREEEQRKRKEAEDAAASALNQNLVDFLRGCHKLSTKLLAATDITTATSGSTTNPVNRLFPKRILPWSDFSIRQHSFWCPLRDSNSMWNECAYPSATIIDYVEKLIDPIGSEDDLRYLERLTLENMVRNIFERMSNDDEIKEILGYIGDVSFENQPSFRADEINALGRTIEGLSIDSSGERRPKNTRADQFCVVRNRNGIARPIVAIEYKAPHKLTIKEICIGLRSEIWPERDVIDKHEDDFEFLCRNLLAAVITQLFSNMIDKRVRYGYVCTGEAFIFVRIPEDPTVVYFSVNVPNRDYADDQANRLQRTAVSQVVAFIHQALQDEQPDQAWIDSARSNLGRWKVEFIDVLQKIPVTERKSRDASLYRPSKWVPSDRRSPISLRNRCRPEASPPKEDSSSDDGDGEGDVTSPTHGRQTRSMAAAPKVKKGTDKKQGDTRGPSDRESCGLTESHMPSGVSIPTIECRPFCTHECLRGLTTRGPIDQSCPNAAAHGQKHIPKEVFLRYIRQQLAVDRGQNADCFAMCVHGARGALLKVCLTSHGYTLVAKGVIADDQEYLQRELQIYDKLVALQGVHVPVCCGLVHLELPFYYDGSELWHLLFMSWAGRPLMSVTRNEVGSKQSGQFLQLSIQALNAIHKQRVLHHDVFPRNMVYDEDSERLMMIDFERSEVLDHDVLGELSPNRKRKVVNNSRKRETDCFAEEIRTLEFYMSKDY